MVDRRRSVVLTLALAFLAAVAVGAAQERKPARIAILSRSAPPEVGAFHEGLQELGHVEGQTYIIEPRYAGGSTARLRELAAELARSRCPDEWRRVSPDGQGIHRLFDPPSGEGGVWGKRSRVRGFVQEFVGSALRTSVGTRTA